MVCPRPCWKVFIYDELIWPPSLRSGRLARNYLRDDLALLHNNLYVIHTPYSGGDGCAAVLAANAGTPRERGPLTTEAE